MYSSNWQTPKCGSKVLWTIYMFNIWPRDSTTTTKEVDQTSRQPLFRGTWRQGDEEKANPLKDSLTSFIRGPSSEHVSIAFIDSHWLTSRSRVSLVFLAVFFQGEEGKQSGSSELSREDWGRRGLGWICVPSRASDGILGRREIRARFVGVVAWSGKVGGPAFRWGWCRGESWDALWVPSSCLSLDIALGLRPEQCAAGEDWLSISRRRLLDGGLGNEGSDPRLSQLGGWMWV